MYKTDLETRCYPTSSHLQQVTGKLEHLLSRIVAGGGFDFQNQPLNPPNNCSGSKWGNVVSELLEFENSLRSLKQPIWEVEASEFKSAVSQRLTRLRNALNNFSSGAYHENGDFTKIQNLLMSIPRMTVDICINLIQRNQSEKALEMYGTDDKIELPDIVKIRHYNNLDPVIQFCADMGKDSVSCFQNLTEQVVESNRLFTDRTIWKLLSILRAVISDSSGDVGPLEESLKRLNLEAVRHYSRQIQKLYEVADEVKKYCPELMKEIIEAAYGNNLDNTEAVTFFCKAIGDEERKNCMVYLSGKVLSVGGWYKNPNILKFKEFISNATDSNEIREINMKLEAALVKHYGVLVRRQGHRVNRKLFRMFDPQLKQGIVRFAYDRNPSYLDPVISFIEYLNGKELVVCYETLFNIMKESGHLKVARLAMKIKFGYLPSKLKKVRDPLTENRRRNLEAQLKSLEVVISVVNGGPFGDWGKKDFCLKGSRATGFMIKNEKPIARGDDTALNGIRLYCHYPDGSFANWISSTEGK